MTILKRNLANTSLILLALFYLIMLGGGNYEHMNVTGVVAYHRPQLELFAGQEKIDPRLLWNRCSGYPFNLPLFCS